MLKNLKLKHKLFTLFFIGILIPITGVSLVVVTNSLPLLRTHVEDTIQEETQLIANEVEEFFASNISTIESLALSQSNLEHNEELLRNLYDNALTENSHFLYLYEGTQDGGMMIEPDVDLGEDFDPRERPWFQGVVESEDTYITEPYIDAASGDPILTIAAPVITEGTNVIGADVTLEFMSDLIVNISDELEGTAYITDSNGTILAHPDEDVVSEETNISDRQYVQATLDGNDSTFEINDNYIGATHLNDLGWGVFYEIPQGAVLGDVEFTQNAIILGLVLTILLTVVLVYFISRTVLTPITNLTHIINKLSQYNFTFDKNSEAFKYLERKDEVGMITKALAAMQDNIVKLLKNVDDKSQYVASSSQQLSANTEENTSAANEVAKAIEEIASGASKQAEETEVVSKTGKELEGLVEKDQTKVNELNEAINNIDTLKNQGTKIIQNLTDKNQETGQAVEQIYNAITSTDKKAREIQEASQFISDIAEQTNLLALNASIEAARAGEYGKGFAVVAEEIRKLAEQTNEQSESIKDIINTLNQQTEVTVNTMKEVQETVQTESQHVKETGDRFENIASGIEKMKHITEELNTSGKQMQEKKADIMEKIQNLASIAEQNSANTEEASSSVEEQTASMDEISTASQELANLAEELKQEADKFTY